MPGEVARAYHEATKHTYESVRRARALDLENRPAPFKRYLDDLEGVALPARGGDPRDRGLHETARVLTYGAGVIREARYGAVTQHFRTYASAGALYPNEVYVVCAELPGLPAGVYHFDPLELALRTLRTGDHRGHVVRAAASRGRAETTAESWIALTGAPWRTAWKYGERGYRHVFWDAGMIAANLVQLASPGCSIVTGFVDDELEKLLRIDGVREFPVCLVAVHSPDAPAPVVPASAAADHVHVDVAPLSAREEHQPLSIQTNDAGRLADPDAVDAWRRSPVASRPARLRRTIEDVLRTRGSARRFGPGSIAADDLSELLLEMRGGMPEPASTVVFVIANDVEGLPPGAYRFDPGQHATRYVRIRHGHLRREAGHLCLGQSLGADAAATIFLCVDLDASLREGGDRAYRTANLQAGMASGRIYLGAYAQGLGATGLTFYDDAVSSFFDTPMSCMLVTAVGRTPGRRPLPLRRR